MLLSSQLFDVRSRRPILVTGSNRSGSTWIGKTISHAAFVRYIHEPFNVVMAEQDYNQTLPRWFHHVTTADEGNFYRYFQKVLHIPYSSTRELLAAKTQRERHSVVSKTVRHYVPQLLGVRPLLKDPIAIFSADWLSSRFPMDVVVIIRHPAAYVRSVLKDPSHMHSLRTTFVEQPSLMTKVETIKSDIVAACNESLPLFMRAAIFWKAIHLIIYQYQEAHPDWLFYRYEDIAESPLLQFSKLASQLNLKETPSMEQYIRSHAMNETPASQDYTTHVKKYCSAKQYNSWKRQLTAEQISEVKEITMPVSSYFYTEEDW